MKLNSINPREPGLVHVDFVDNILLCVDGGFDSGLTPCLLDCEAVGLRRDDREQVLAVDLANDRGQGWEYDNGGAEIQEHCCLDVELVRGRPLHDLGRRQLIL